MRGGPPSSTLVPYTTLFRPGAASSGEVSMPASRSVVSPSRRPARTPHRKALDSWMEKFGSPDIARSEEHTSELQSRQYLVCRLLLEKNKPQDRKNTRMNSRH